MKVKTVICKAWAYSISAIFLCLSGMPSYADSTSRNRIECLQSCENNEKCTPTGGINQKNLDN